MIEDVISIRYVDINGVNQIYHITTELAKELKKYKETRRYFADAFRSSGDDFLVRVGDRFNIDLIFRNRNGANK